MHIKCGKFEFKSSLMAWSNIAGSRARSPHRAPAQGTLDEAGAESDLTQELHPENLPKTLTATQETHPESSAKKYTRPNRMNNAAKATRSS